MKICYIAIDGTAFDSIEECKQYENKKVAELSIFKNSRVWSDYSKTPQPINNRDTICPTYIYVGKGEEEQVRLWAKTRNRNFKGNAIDEGCIYVSQCMTYINIEDLIESEEDKIRSSQKLIKIYKKQISKIKEY